MLLPPGVPAQLEPLILALQSGMHMLPRMPQFPTLSIPVTATLNSLGLMATSSTYSSGPSSPAILDISLLSHHSKHQ
ncbi:hypothetical protein PAXRUDRAFT_323774 [Paxillus rubicundulus Ve08.2h10]|uniref:Uncharacterized protein n=1 Tax=Paxillus rubicundulus Ve08.2h10 TaxID=930991 RepID=A0A0D0D4G8_9AGAM|nr:hypothetical protein PAXRUDRAFT_323774 [Paxillus rubicundulus Ve08.2h10]